MSEDTTSKTANKAAGAGKGLAFIAFAKFFFIVAGYAQQLLLPRFLGSQEAFGRYAAVVNIVGTLTNVLIAATIQNVSRRVIEDEARGKEFLREALINQLMLGSALSMGMFLLAPLLAGRMLLQPELEPYFRIASVVVLAYSLYAAVVGYLNGSRRFLAQAGLDVTFSVLRSIGLLALPFLGYGIGGAYVGFATAAVSITLVSFFVAGTGTRPSNPDRKSWWQSLRALWVYQLCLNLILQVDLSVLGRTFAEMSIANGVDPQTASDLASKASALYRSAQTFAFVPYQFILSVTFIVFPLIAKAVGSGDHDAARLYISRAMRLSLIVLMAVAAPVAGAADGVLRIAYPAEYIVASDALRVLVLGLVPFALFVIGATVLSGAGMANRAAQIAVASVAVVLVATRVLIMRAGPSHAALIAAACGTSIGALIALIAVGAVVHRRFGAFLPPFNVLRIALCAAIGAGVAQLVPHATRVTAFGALVAGGIAYAVALVATREMPISEIRQLLKR